MRLASLTVCNVNDPTQIVPIIPADEFASTYSFYMPPFGVVVMAAFGTGTWVDETNNDNAIAVFPNPTQNVVRIEAENLRHISVFNMIGQQIYNNQANGNEFEFDFSEHEAGIYLIRIETASGIVTKRVVVAK